MPKMLDIDMEKIIEIMQRLDFFEEFSKLELQRMLIPDSQVYLYEKGEHIIEKDDIDSSFFIILSGIVYIITDYKIITNFTAGMFFGEMSFLTKEPRIATAIANDDCLIMKIDDIIMERLHLRVKERIKDKIIQKLVSDIKYMNKLLDKS